MRVLLFQKSHQIVTKKLKLIFQLKFHIGLEPGATSRTKDRSLDSRAVKTRWTFPF